MSKHDENTKKALDLIGQSLIDLRDEFGGIAAMLKKVVEKDEREAKVLKNHEERLQAAESGLAELQQAHG